MHSVALHPTNSNQILVSNKSNTVFVMTMEGQVVATYQSGKQSGGDFIGMVVSPRGSYVYCLGEDNTLYCFGVASGKLEHLMEVHEGGGIGLVHHPHRNMIATYG